MYEVLRYYLTLYYEVIKIRDLNLDKLHDTKFRLFASIVSVVDRTLINIRIPISKHKT